VDGISKVLQRMDGITQRFNHYSVNTNTFSTVLAGVKSNDAVGEKSFASNEISKMIDFTAKKYGVDPKLAMAVAKAESNLSPDVVSSAGAVGVMQLMPDTAQGLGVRNSKDPRENIDGGVRYLKELITSFEGDIPKAIAAYNAGPQAVKKYNGIPPYPETKAYVAKVMSLAT
jgi:soluble lytic murein transglycosylase-like protein